MKTVEVVKNQSVGKSEVDEHTVYKLMPVNCRNTPTKFFQVVEGEDQLAIGDVIKIVKPGEQTLPNSLGYRVKSIDPLDLEALMIMADGEIVELNIQKKEPEPTCEGCRSLKYNGIPKWVCKKKKMGTDIQQQQGNGFSGYPIRGNCDDYRK